MTTAKWMICRTPVRACGVRVCTGVLASVLLLVGVSPAIGQYDQGEAQAIEEALHEHGIASSVASADVVTAWNEQAHDIAFAEDSFLTFKGQRALAMTHMAMHDALNSIVPLYERYAYSGRPQIAHRWRRLRKPRTKWSSANTRISNRSSRPSSPSGSDGCRTARFAPVASRLGVRRRRPSWRCEPAMASTCLGPTSFGAGRASIRPRRPGMASWRSRGFDSRSRSCSPPGSVPAAASTSADEQGLRARVPGSEGGRLGWEHAAHGGSDGVRRVVGGVRGRLRESPGAAARNRARPAPLDRREALRAHRDGALRYLCGGLRFEVRIQPPAAVHRHPSGGRRRQPARTTPDITWEPLQTTPPFPEYACAHATACAASFGVLARTLGHKLSFTMETTTAPPGMPTRSFESFDAAAAECADSRVGWHYRYSTDAGLALGWRIAKHTVPVRRDDADQSRLKVHAPTSWMLRSAHFRISCTDTC